MISRVQPMWDPVRAVTLVAGACLLGCAPVPYQRAEGWAGGGRDGYLDQQIGPGLYVVEVQQIGGYQQIMDHAGTMKIYVGYWHRRASELCPGGYTGVPYKIRPYQARILAFRCDLNLCQDYPMISGVVKCSDEAQP